MNHEYTFDLEETVSRQWTFTCHADSAESAFDMAKTHLLSPITQWARQANNTTEIDRVIKARVNGTYFDLAELRTPPKGELNRINELIAERGEDWND